MNVGRPRARRLRSAAGSINSGRHILESRCAERCANDAFSTSFRATLISSILQSSSVFEGCDELQTSSFNGKALSWNGFYRLLICVAVSSAFSFTTFSKAFSFYTTQQHSNQCNEKWCRSKDSSWLCFADQKLKLSKSTASLRCLGSPLGAACLARSWSQVFADEGNTGSRTKGKWVFELRFNWLRMGIWICYSCKHAPIYLLKWHTTQSFKCLHLLNVFYCAALSITLLLLLFAGSIFCEFLRFGKNCKIKYPQKCLPTYQAPWCIYNHKLRDDFSFWIKHDLSLLFVSAFSFLHSGAITISKK